MSNKNPNHNEVKEGTGVNNYHKSYHNLAKAEFHNTHGRSASLDDVSELAAIHNSKAYSKPATSQENDHASYKGYTDYSTHAYDGVAEDI